MPKKSAKKRGQNEGTIRQRKDGKWEARYTVGINADGSQKQTSIYGKTRPEVAQRLNKIINSLNDGIYMEPQKITVTVWLNTWFKEYVLPSKRPSTIRGYDDIIRLYLVPGIGHITLKDLRPDHVQSMINAIQNKIPARYLTRISNLEKKLVKAKEDKKAAMLNQIEEHKKQRIKPLTIEHIIVMLGTSLGQAMMNGLVTRNVAKMVVKPKVEQEDIEFLEIEEQSKLMEVLSSHRTGFAFEFCLATGLRQSEILGLRWEDIDFKKGTISIKQTLMRQRKFTEDGQRVEAAGSKTEIVKGKPKTKKGNREIPLQKAILKKLEKHDIQQKEERVKLGPLWNNTGLVFTSEIGTHIEPRKLLQVFHRLLAKAGLAQRGLHTLRHTFATRAVEAGFDIKTLSEILGHEDVATTMNLYVHSSDVSKKKHMDKLNYLFTT